MAGPVDVRVTWTDGCTAFLLGPGSGPAAWVDGPDFMCLNPSRWRSTGYLAAWTPAHEHVHNLQAQLGCFPGPDAHEWQWLFEGMANQFAFDALLDAGLVTAEEAERYVWEYRGLEDDIGTLADYELSSDAAGDAYGLFYLGTRVLAQGAGTPTAFVDFCRAAAGGVPWRDAFEASFGITVPDLYGLVEAERARLRPMYDCAEPPCGGTAPPA